MKDFTALNLGCGKDSREGIVNVDRVALDGINLVTDLNEDLPFLDDCIDYIVCMRVVEHLTDIKSFFEEIYRILKPEGVFEFRVPLGGTPTDYCDLTHCNHFWPKAFLALDRNRSQVSFMFKCNFRVEKICVTPPLLSRLKFPYWFAYMNLFFNIFFSAIEGRLVAVK